RAEATAGIDAIQCERVNERPGLRVDGAAPRATRVVGRLTAREQELVERLHLCPEPGNVLGYGHADVGPTSTRLERTVVLGEPFVHPHRQVSEASRHDGMRVLVGGES